MFYHTACNKYVNLDNFNQQNETKNVFLQTYMESCYHLEDEAEQKITISWLVRYHFLVCVDKYDTLLPTYVKYTSLQFQPKIA